MANLRIPRTGAGIGQPNPIGVPNLPSTGELLGSALSGFGEAMAQQSQYETDKVIRQNPPQDIFTDAISNNFDYEEYTPDGEMDLVLSYKKLSSIINDSDFLLNKAKQEAFESIDSLNVGFAGKKEVARQVDDYFKDLGDSLAFKNTLVKAKDAFENSILEKFESSLKTFNLTKQGEESTSQNQHYFSVDQTALEEGVDFYESLSLEDKASRKFQTLGAYIAGAQSSIVYEQAYYNLLNAIEEGQGSDFVQGTGMDMVRFSNWAKATGIYGQIKNDPDVIVEFAKAFNAKSIAFPKSFVKEVYEPFMSKPSYAGREVDAFYALIDAAKYGAQDLDKIVTDRIEYFIKFGSSAPSSKGVNELLAQFNTFQKPKSEAELKTAINAVLKSDIGGLNELIETDIEELDSLDDRIGRLSEGSKQTFIHEMRAYQHEELRAMVNENRLYSLSESDAIKKELLRRSYRRWMANNAIEYVEEPSSSIRGAAAKGMLTYWGFAGKYRTFPSVPVDRGVYVSPEDFKRSLEDKLSRLYRTEVPTGKELKKKVQNSLDNGAVIKSSTDFGTYMFELDNEPLFAISQEEIVLNTIDPSAIVSIADLTFNLNDTMKASLGIRSGESKENYDLFKDWEKETGEDVLKGYPYQEQAAGITSTDEFKALDSETQKEVLSYLGNRIGYLTTQNPLYANPAFLKKYKKSNYTDYNTAYDEYFRDLVKMEDSELKSHLQEVASAPFTFDLLYENELALVGKGGPKSVKASTILKAFKSKLKRADQDEGLYAESPPQDLKPYIDAEKYSANEVAKAMEISIEDFNVQMGEIDFDNSILVDALRYYFSSLLADSGLEKMPMAMTNKQLKAVLKALEGKK